MLAVPSVNKIRKIPTTDTLPKSKSAEMIAC